MMCSIAQNVSNGQRGDTLEQDPVFYTCSDVNFYKTLARLASGSWTSAMCMGAAQKSAAAVRLNRQHERPHAQSSNMVMPSTCQAQLTPSEIAQ